MVLGALLTFDEDQEINLHIWYGDFMIFFWDASKIGPVERKIVAIYPELRTQPKPIIPTTFLGCVRKCDKYFVPLKTA